MRHALLLFSFFALLAVASAQSEIGTATRQAANQTISSAANYIELVNESSYLIFYPNLTQAYSDLAKAQNLYNTSPTSSVVYANKAAGEASAEYERISRYKSESIIVMLVLTALFALLLVILMRPVRNGTGKRRAK